MAALRAEIREQADELHTAVDTAVDSAQWWTQVGIRAARVLIEGVYQRREAGYLDEQRRWEQFRETAKDILNQGVQNWASLRAAAQTAFEKGDTEMEQQRNRLFASEAGHLQWHENRWLEDKAAVDREIAESAEANAAVVDKVLDGIQLTLDVAGFAPGVGAVPDVINAMISAGRGNYGEALFNLAVAIPFWGDAAKGGKMLAKAGQEGITHADEVISMSTALAKNGDKAKDILKAGDETGNAFGKNLDEVAKDDAIVHMLDDGEDISALGITAFSQFTYASRFGFKSYDELAAATKGMGVEVHHLIEKRFHEVMGQERGEMLSIVLTPTEHQKFTNAWHAHFPRLREAAHIPYNELSPKQIEEAAREIYAGFPEILKALGLN